MILLFIFSWFLNILEKRKYIKKKINTAEKAIFEL